MAFELGPDLKKPNAFTCTPMPLDPRLGFTEQDETDMFRDVLLLGFSMLESYMKQGQPMPSARIEHPKFLAAVAARRAAKAAKRAKRDDLRVVKFSASK
jgi:hypothetical protein